MAIRSPMIMAVGIVCVILVLIAGAFLAWLYVSSMAVAGFVQNPEELRDQFMVGSLSDSLPSTARDIRYFCQPRSGYRQAVFAITESEFLSWANGCGWAVVAIDPRYPETVWVIGDQGLSNPWDAFYGSHKNAPVAIAQGWYFLGAEATRAGAQVEVAYDRPAGRAYFFSLLGR